MFFAPKIIPFEIIHLVENTLLFYFFGETDKINKVFINHPY